MAGVTLAGMAVGVVDDVGWDTRERLLPLSIRFPQAVLILALDTTTRGGSIAVVQDDQVLSLLAGDASRTHAERLPAEIAAALDAAGVTRDAIDLLAVATGPGGFTGLRIGLAAVQGLAMTLHKPVAGVSTLDALAAQASGTTAAVIVPWMDAQRGDVFAAIVDARTGAGIEAPIVEAPAAVIARFRARLDGHPALFIGDAVSRDAGMLAAAGQGRWTTQVPGALAPQIALLGRRRAAAGKAGPPHALEPLYIRRPDAEIEREKRGNN
jgi:tRNA threonylcarbamoyladenosine biosynthesis protein TsaB